MTGDGADQGDGHDEGRLVRVVLEGETPHRLSAAQQADLEQAVKDLGADNVFRSEQHPRPRSILHLSIQDSRLVFDIRDEADVPIAAVGLALSPFKKLIADYQLMLDSYETAMAEGREARIQAIDMGRRGLHNEAAALMRTRLAGKVRIDFETARRLFTLVCALHQKL